MVNTTGGPLGNAGAHETLSEMRAKFSGLIYDFSVLNLIEEHEANFVASLAGKKQAF